MKLWKIIGPVAAVLACRAPQAGPPPQRVADTGGAWRISAPAGWQVQRRPQMTMLAARDGKANVVVWAGPREPGGVEEWLDSLAGQLRQQNPTWKLLGKQPLTVAGRPGLLARSESVTQGIVMHADTVLVQGTRQQVMLSCNCPKSDFATHQRTFGGIIASLELVEGPPAVTGPPAGTGSPARRAPVAAPAPLSPVAHLKWERYTSKQNLFTVLAPAGWKVTEGFNQNAAYWSCTISDPRAGWQASVLHGASLTGRDVDALARHVIASMRKAAPDLRLAPTGRAWNASGRRVIVFEGAYGDAQKRQRREFRSMVSGGDGLMLLQNIEAPEGELTKAAPVLLQTLANLRVANLVKGDPGDRGVMRAPARMVPQRLPSGWVRFSAPADWRSQDLGKGALIVTDPSQRLFFFAAGCEFVSMRYCMRGVPGLLCSDFLSPHEGYAFSAVKNGQASDFRFLFVKPRPDLVQILRAGPAGGPLRRIEAEDFAYTCMVKGAPYTGFSTGSSQGDAMQASWKLSHFSIMAPSAEFEAALPTLVAVLSSYELNGEMAGRQMAANMSNYYAGLRRLSNQIAQNSEQMRRENLQIMINNDRVRDYTSYQTTRMIMGDFHYLAGESGYVISNPDGLFTPDGQVLSREPYGGSITQGMQEINTRELYEAIRP